MAKSLNHTTAAVIVLCGLVWCQRAGASGYTLPTTPTDGAADLPASERGLTAIDCSTQLLAKEGNRYYKGVTERRFKGQVLGYVTPWNGHGYEVAKRWRGKFTHISPVWYQLRADGTSGRIHLTGAHDVDQAWMKALRKPVTAEEAQCSSVDAGTQTCSADASTSRAPPLIVPRVIMELSLEQLSKMAQAPEDAIRLVVQETQDQKFDGIVLECWLTWASMGLLRQDKAATILISLVHEVALALHAAGKVLLLAIPPVVPSDPERPGAEVEHMQRLAAFVDGFSVMTYDYSATGPGPNAPLPWQEKNAKALMALPQDSRRSQVVPRKVLLGLNFYGYDWQKQERSSDTGSSDTQGTKASPIMGNAFLAVLRKVKAKLKWEAEHAEHRIKYKEGGVRHTIYYPTPAALAARIQLAEQLGVGLSIWELGQGLDAFMDLL